MHLLVPIIYLLLTGKLSSLEVSQLIGPVPVYTYCSADFLTTPKSCRCTDALNTRLVDTTSLSSSL